MLGMTLRDRFTATVDAIATRLIETFELRFTREVAHLASPVMRWLDFRRRHVEPMPRTAIASDRFPLPLPPQAVVGLERLVAMFERGDDVNPYQGRGLRMRNDTSGGKRHARTDLIYADWGILHFHLPNGPIPPGRYFAPSSDWLAFCLIADTQVAFIDVRPHGDRTAFAEPELLATALRSWPDFAERHRLKGISGEDAPDKGTIHALREGGVNRFFTHEGSVYAGPGGGVMTAGVPLHLVRLEDTVADFVDQVAAQVDDPSGYYRMYPTVRLVHEPVFDLRLHEEGLGLFEATSKTLFQATSGPPSAQRSGMSGLSDLLVPPWALPSVRAAKARFDALWCEPAMPQADRT